MDTDDLIRFAETQMLQAELAKGPARVTLIHEAKDALIRAESIERGSGAWLMACINARTGNASMCRAWIERAAKAGKLPPPEELEKTPDLKSVRSEKWFRKLLREYAQANDGDC